MGTTVDRAGRGGFTLIEALIVLAILGIVAVIAAGTFRGAGEKYRVEGETKQMYADLMDARARAMQRNRASFVRITVSGYRTFEDTDPAPDGNGTLDTTADTLVASVTARHAITAALAGVASGFTFNRNGTASTTGHVRISSAAEPDYDCVGIGITRIHLGKYNSGTGACVEK